MTSVFGPDFLAIQVRELQRSQALHDQLKSRGVPILADPFDTPYGRTFVFEDPDGYAIAIHGAPESACRKDAGD
jgi:predicted enzyme related to lactoylglutathione lyase